MDWGSTANQSFLAGPLKTQLLRVVPHRRPMSAKPQNTIVGAFRVFLHPNNYLGGGRQIGQHRSFNHVRQKPRANNRRGQLPWEGVGCSPRKLLPDNFRSCFPQPSPVTARQPGNATGRGNRDDKTERHQAEVKEPPGPHMEGSPPCRAKCVALGCVGRPRQGPTPPPPPTKGTFFVKENSFGAGGATENRCPDGA